MAPRYVVAFVSAAWAVAGLVGCYANVGPVLVDVRVDHGQLRYVKCDLIVGRSLFNIGSDDLEHCVDELGRAMASPTPDRPYALVTPVSTGPAPDAGAAVDNTLDVGPVDSGATDAGARAHHRR